MLFSHLGGRREGKGESSQHIDFREPQKAKEIENKNKEKEVWSHNPLGPKLIHFKIAHRATTQGVNAIFGILD